MSMPYPRPSDMHTVRQRETRRLQGGAAALDSQATRPGDDDPVLISLDALLSSVRPAEPPSTFAAQVMLGVARRKRRQRTMLKLRRILTVFFLVAAMVAGAAVLVSVTRTSHPEFYEVVGRALMQVASVLQSLLVAVRVVLRAIPVDAGGLLVAWLVAAVIVSILWFKVLGKVQPQSVHV